LSETWQSNKGEQLTALEINAFKEQCRIATKEREQDQINGYMQSAKKAIKILSAATKNPLHHPYALKKRAYLGDIKRGEWLQSNWKDALIVPIYDSNNTLSTLQAINVNGDKRFLSGGKKKGCYYSINLNSEADIIYIGEGLATCAAVYDALAKPVVCAFDAENLIYVAKRIKREYPNAEIILLADNDLDPERKNAGLLAARKAANEITAQVLIPFLGDGIKCDFWDVWDKPDGKAAINEAFNELRQHWRLKTMNLDIRKKEDSDIATEAKYFRAANCTAETTLPMLPMLPPLNEAQFIIDEALKICEETPSALFTESFNEAARLIKETDKGLWAEYRVKIKKHKPSGVLLKDIDRNTAPPSETEAADSIAAQLIQLAIESGALFFDEEKDKSFLTLNNADDKTAGNQTLMIGSKPFIEWLSYAFYKETQLESGKGTGLSASEAAIKQTCFALAGIAKHEGEKLTVHLRTATHNGGHYIFIGDEQLQVIEVTATGWRVITNPPVKFWQPSLMKSLPIPQANGDLSKLWDFLNIPEKDQPLVLAWILESYRNETPNLILALSGLQGSAKSSTQNKIRELIDNNALNLRAAPKTIEDIFIGAGCNYLISYENLSHMSGKMQDALCIAATGGGAATRTLFTNDEETVLKVKRPVIINSIPRVITAQDLTDRALCIELPTIEYREELEINAAWDNAKPAIFGGLLDLFVKTLAQLPTVNLKNKLRMADFTRLGEAMTQALGKDAGVFDELYRANRTESVLIALESSPVGLAIRDMVDNHSGSSDTVFFGTVKNLYDQLKIDSAGNSESFPRSPRGLSEVIKRQNPALQALGISIVQGTKPERLKEGRGLTIKIIKNSEIKKDGNVVNIGNIVSAGQFAEKFLHTNSAAYLGVNEVEL
ncbi:MAG: hypothetical protein ACOYM1_12045, partial [Methylovulum sp.]